MRIEEDIKLDFKDVLIKPKRSRLESRNQVDINRKFTFLHSKQVFQGIPIIAANMDTTGTIRMMQTLKSFGLMTALHKHYTVETLAEIMFDQFCFYTMGIKEVDREKLQAVQKQCEIKHKGYSFAKGEIVKNICIDVANGYTERFVDFIKRMRDEYPGITIMAGNVVTGEMVEQLILAGADIVKVGIGPGSVCTTRAVTGVGYPQLSAVIECADAAHGLGGQVAADGGCQTSGDIVKAFGGGADFVMLGGMLAGHDECEGEIVEIDGEKQLRFYGMSSQTAMEQYSGGVAAYRASEGKCVYVSYKGPVAETVQTILGGLRSACTYVGAHYLKELPKRTTFIRVSQQLNPMFGPYQS